MRIVKAEPDRLAEAVGLAGLLWPGHSSDELSDELRGVIGSPDAAIFLACREERTVGYAQCSIRREYVTGCSSFPVGYLEGIFVCGEFRRNGIAARLLEACEAWARGKGCLEFASDCELGNEPSRHFHLGSGFSEAERVICFVKPLR